MIAVTDYTSYAEIRAVLGVDALELSDTTLGLQTYATALYRALVSITDGDGDSLITLYDVINPLDMTDAEELLYYTIKEYATYIVASSCCSGISMFALRSDSDGTATQSRFASDTTFKDVVKAIQDKVGLLASTLNYMLFSTTEYAIPGLTVVTPAIDRVTDE